MGTPLQLYLQMLAQQQQQQGQPDQPAQQMSQQGQFNPAAVQAQGGAGPQPFSFAPVQGGLGRNILNALANAGKAATYVAEDPRERERDDARAQQLYETKQKMAMAAGEFGQREKDRASQAATRQQEFSQREKDRATQSTIAQAEFGQREKDRQAQAATAKQEFDQRQQDRAQQEKDRQAQAAEREKEFGQREQERKGEFAQREKDRATQLQIAKMSSGEKLTKPYRDIIGTYDDSEKLRAMANAGNASADPDLALAFFKMIRGGGGAGIRFTQQEQKLILGARNTMGDLEAFGQKVMGGGQALTPEQRTNMLAVMKVHRDAAQREIDRVQGGLGAAPQGQTAPSGGSGDPLGIR